MASGSLLLTLGVLTLAIADLLASQFPLSVSLGWRDMQSDIEVDSFDQAIKTLVAVTDGDLETELVQIKLLTRRLLAGVV